MAFYGDAALAFEGHIIEDLIHHFSFGDSASGFQESIGESGLAMIYVGYDAEISNKLGRETHCVCLLNLVKIAIETLILSILHFVLTKIQSLDKVTTR
jgi:hypothetical protein